MTTPVQPSRDRALGRSVSALLPSSAPVAPAEVAAAALAALWSVPVQIGVLQTAAALLDEAAHAGEEDDARHRAAADTVALLRAAMDREG
ncbi:hypothetical protein ACFU99_14190 [Streptomyces sp. NPDC057654]|uniref:hypothetical protein n=1 Tax=Streptomyces sp. NPDC057654 TaxID=3346196 RepID=UPI0036BA524F